jgi:hypothetical protein
MSIEQRIIRLRQKLIRLGYYPFQIKNIVKEAIGNIEVEQADYAQLRQLICTLEGYEKLGHEFVTSYSK